MQIKESLFLPFLFYFLNIFFFVRTLADLARLFLDLERTVSRGREAINRRFANFSFWPSNLNAIFVSLLLFRRPSFTHSSSLSLDFAQTFYGF